jgi:hypothetical protein
MSPLLIREVARRGVHGNTVVLYIRPKSAYKHVGYRSMKETYPDYNSAGLVWRADLVVSCLRDVVEEELEQILGLLILEPDDPARKTRVDVQCLLARDGVLAHDRVLRHHNSVHLPLWTWKKKEHTSVSTGSRRTGPPRLRENSACSTAECTARKPSSRFWNSGESRLYASTCDRKSVSPPPFSGWSRIQKKVVPGGWRSYDYDQTSQHYARRLGIESTYDIRVPTGLAGAVTATIFFEPVVIRVTVDCTECQYLYSQHRCIYIPTWNSGKPSMFPEVGWTWMGPKCLHSMEALPRQLQNNIPINNHYLAISICLSGDKSLKSWSLNTTTFFSAARSASSSRPSLVSCEICTPETIAPMYGLIWRSLVPGPRR